MIDTLIFENISGTVRNELWQNYLNLNVRVEKFQTSIEGYCKKMRFVIE